MTGLHDSDLRAMLSRRNNSAEKALTLLEQDIFCASAKDKAHRYVINDMALETLRYRFSIFH